MSKYNAKKSICDGITFDSNDEMLYYQLLKKHKNKGIIKDFELQPTYVLINGFTKNDKKYRQITYTPDFRVYHLDGTIECIDVKGFSTQQGDLRRKLFDSRYDEKLAWVSRSIKYGNADGWISYDELKKKRRENK
jgi:hypothetical protein